ncbi:MAG: hypothetical protein RSF90_00610 [Pygmaiobacter sp.]
MFTVAKRAIADVEPILYKTPKAGETFTLGEALKEAAGVLTAVAATDRPGYVCAGGVTKGGMLPVIRVLPTTFFKTISAVAVGTALIGSAVTLTADALGVTATTANGVFTVDETDGASPSVVIGYFK